MRRGDAGDAGLDAFCAWTIPTPGFARAPRATGRDRTDLRVVVLKCAFRDLPHRHRSRTGTEHIGDQPHPANIGEQIRGGRIMAARGERLRGGSDGTSAGIALRLPERVRI